MLWTNNQDLTNFLRDILSISSSYTWSLRFKESSPLQLLFFLLLFCILFSLNHSTICLKWKLTFLFISLKQLLIYNIFMTSTKWWTFKCVTAACKLLIYVRNRSGPRTDPWRTSKFIGTFFDYFNKLSLIHQVVLENLNGVPLTW